jgi:hypothetical protein
MLNYIIFGFMLMSLLEVYIHRIFDKSLLQFMMMMVNTMMPYIDPTMETEEYTILSNMMYIMSYLLWPITLVMIVSKTTGKK